MIVRDSLTLSNAAIYLPSITASFARAAFAGAPSARGPVSLKDLNFLDPNSGVFSYPCALYSAGQAARTDAAAKQNCIVSERDRMATVIVGDSGGFQIQEGSIQFDGADTARRMLRWLEKTADLSMVLDFPTGGISSGQMRQHAERLTAEGRDLAAMCQANGQSIDFNACLLQTKLNNDVFVDERTPGATLLLNVYQGRNEGESKAWYEAVKHYPFEGVAFAGSHQTNIGMVLNRLLDLQQDGILERIKWAHVLGISTLPMACLFTTVQKLTRRYFNPEIQFSFDSASPFLGASQFNVVTGYTLDKVGWSIHSISMAGEQRGDQRSLNEFCYANLPRQGARRTSGTIAVRRSRWPAETNLGARISVSDICAGGTGSSNVDTLGVHMLMNHNVNAYVNAFRRAYKIYLDGQADFIPVPLLRARILLEDAFKEMAAGRPRRARRLVHLYSKYMNYYAG